MYTGLMHSHSSLAYLLLLSTTASVLIAHLVTVRGPTPGLLKIGRILARGVEMSLVGLVGLLGLAMWAVAPWPIATWWLWVGLVAVVGSSVLIARGIKPTLKSLAAGEGGASRWLGFAVVQWLLIVGTVTAMHAH